jgi:uncharacterized membrane protein
MITCTLRERLTNLKVTMPLAFRMVFSVPLYIGIAAAIFTTFWIIFNTFDQLLFFSPVWSFYVPDDAITNITSVLQIV